MVPTSVAGNPLPSPPVRRSGEDGAACRPGRPASTCTGCGHGLRESRPILHFNAQPCLKSFTPRAESPALPELFSAGRSRLPAAAARTARHHAGLESQEEMRTVALDVLSWLAVRLRPPPRRAAGAAKSRRVEQAQRRLLDAMPTPMIVVSLGGSALLHANRAARPWLAGPHGEPLRTLPLEPAVGERFQALAGRDGGVDDFPLRWPSARGVQRTLASARPFDFLGRAALLTTLTAVGPVEPIGGVPSASGGATAAPLLALPLPDAVAAAPGAQSRCLVRLREALVRAAHEGHRVSAVMLQLDNAAALDAMMGRDGTEALRRAVEARLGDALRAVDAVCRLGDDGYAVVLAAAATTGQIERIVRRLVGGLRRPSDTEAGADADTPSGGGRALDVTCSVGVAVFPTDDHDAETLLQRATTTMRAAQARGGNQTLFFAPDLAAAVHNPAALHDALPLAVASGALRLHYRPRVDAVTGRACGFDALLRWQHPEHGLLDAQHFMPLAEATGDAHALVGWALGETCAQQRRWQAEGLPALAVSLHIGAAQLLDARFAPALSGLLTESGVEPALIGLALAEPAVAGCDAALADALRRVAALGCGLAIDAFGTGRSRLDDLHDLPFDALRIDASFICDLRGGADPAIVKAMVTLGRALGLRVGADGVAHADEESVLLASGCDELQGALYGPPMKGGACAAWLRAHGDLRTGAVLVDP